MTTTDPIKTIKPSDLPSPRQAAMEIMRACSRDDVSNKRLSELATSDPILTAELLRIVNSPFFGFAREVTSITHAISVIGQQALRNLALCISVRDSFREEELPGLDTTAYWEDSLRRAISAKLLGKISGIDVDDCFTAGLLQDFGLLVLFYIYPEQIPAWGKIHSQDPKTRYNTEQAIFGTTHDAVMEMLGKAWGLPDDLSQSIGAHHHPNTKTNTKKELQYILYCADWLSAIFSAEDKNQVLEYCRKFMGEKFGMDQDKINDCLTEIPQQVGSAATALGLHIKQQMDFDQVLRKTNVKLAEDNLSYQELTWRLQNALNERDRLAEELNRELDLAREIQQSLLPDPRSHDFPIAGTNVSARQLSGDFYDYFELDNGSIYFNLADVSGKGMHAALLMAKTCSLFRCLGKKAHNPSGLLEQINKELCETSIRGMFVTMSAGLYYPNSGDLYMVNAGNPPALLFRSKRLVRTINSQAPPLGILPDSKFPITKINIKDCCLYMFTDGVTEGYLKTGKELGLKGLLDLLIEMSDLTPYQRLEAIVARFNVSSAPLRDDISILLIEHTHDRLKKTG